MPPRQKTENVQVSVHYLKIGDVIRMAGMAYGVTKISRINNDKYEIRANPNMSVDDDEEIIWVVPAKGLLEVTREVSPDAYYFSLGSKQEAWDFWVDVLSSDRADWKPATIERIEQIVRETQS